MKTIIVIFTGLAAMMAAWQLSSMAVLTADRNTQSREGAIAVYPVVATEVIYKGALVAVDAAGFLTAAADAANLRIVGVADEQIDNDPGADGDLSCRVVSGRKFRFAAIAITQALVNQVMYVVDDQTFDDSLGTNGIKAGRLVEFISTTEGWIYIPKGGLGDGITDADADATYSANEQTLINALKAAMNDGVLS